MVSFGSKRRSLLLAVLLVAGSVVGLVLAATPEKLAPHAHAGQQVGALGAQIVTPPRTDLESKNSTETVVGDEGEEVAVYDDDENAQGTDGRVGRNLLCTGYWSGYGDCSGGQRCRTYTSTYVAPYKAPAYVAPFIDIWSSSYWSSNTFNFGYRYSGWNSFSWNQPLQINPPKKRRSLQEAGHDRRSLLCTATGEEQCTTSGCAQPVDCAGYWTGYGDCSGGQKCKYYVHSTSAANGGADCPYGNYHADCKSGGCPTPTNCVGSWGGYGSCSGGQKCRYYVHSTSAANGGQSCPYSNYHADCKSSDCPQPVNCQGYWTGYGGCHKHGSSNRKCRNYKYSTHPQNGGSGCPYSNNYQDCTQSGCSQPVDCIGSFGPYGSCGGDVGGGMGWSDIYEDRRRSLQAKSNQRCRKYKITRNAAHNGAGCPHTNNYVQCTTSGCAQPVNCAGAWGAYGSCTYDSGPLGLSHKNKRCRTYKVTQVAVNGGTGCPHGNNYNQCTTSGCTQPVDCVGSWGAYGSCYKTSSNQNQRCRKYTIAEGRAANGYDCPHANKYQQCTTSGCSQPLNCVGAWGGYGSCYHDGSDHKNKRCRYYSISTNKANGGAGCPYSNNYKQCTTSGCAQPVDCVGSWGAYGSCYKTSSNQNQRCRKYKYTKNAAHNGYGCPHANNYQQYTTSGCSQPVNCVGSWGAYGSCYHDGSDHKNKICRYYKVSTNAAHGGVGCPYNNNYKQCTTSGCSQPKDCAGSCGAYGSCYHDSVTHKNKRCRHYTVPTNAAHNGYGCAYSNNYKQCTMSGCGSQPVDCVGSWGAYGSCYHDNSDHKNKRCKY